MRAIIPCAGFGTRSNAKPGQSKEMLPDPNNKHVPIIQYSLELCKIFNMKPLVITRKEKTDLKQYLFNNMIEFIDIEVEGEWNDTVLKSKDYWERDNMLILPDTRFSNPLRIEDMQQGLKLGNNAVMALHAVTDPVNWGIVHKYTLMEKPKDFQICCYAWGLIAFKDTYGQELFSNVNYLKLDNVGFTFLTHFEDITRLKN